jgi:hypothetical protein
VCGQQHEDVFVRVERARERQREVQSTRKNRDTLFLTGEDAG